MNTVSIDEQTATRIHVLVAEKILGWTKEGRYWANPTTLLVYTHSGGDWDFPDFEPTRNIKHAWEIVDHTELLKRYVLIQESTTGVWQLTADWGKIFVEAETAAQVLCLGALKEAGIDYV